MRSFLFLTSLLIYESFACLQSAPRQYTAPAYQQQYYYGQQGQAPQVAAPARVAAAAADKGPSSPISSGQLSESLFGRSVLLSEFSSNGYNAEGGGPVNYGSALQCNFEQKPCCWANVPSPEDQIDWQLASGVPETERFRNVNIQGNYLVAYAAGAAPSDEAQFVSCSIACASSPIKVRARHWQSENVLLQVCQRESFPSSVNFNPLLNCQEFPSVPNVAFTELVLPKASLIDIVFVASNFVGENGDVAVLDGIELDYETDPNECANTASQSSSGASTGSTSFNNGVVDGGQNINLESTQFRGNGFSTGANSRTATAKGAKTHGAASAIEESNAQSSSSSSVSSSSSSISVHKTNEKTEPIDVTPEMQACERTKCNFEDGTACSYNDAYQTQSIRGLTTRFQVVKGQFMNRVTGVHEGTEGNYYAATYLYPREVAGLQADVGFLPEDRRLRFQYYEGTHGVQLKGCCDSSDNCPFSSDKFVSVSDRMWKYGSFVCPKGTDKFIFLCENTRTNQGACAIDDIQVVENRENITADDDPLC